MLEETRDLVDHLKTYGIAVKHMIINKVFPDLESDFSIERRRQEEKTIREIHRLFSHLQILEVHLQPHEPRGIKELSKFARLITLSKVSG